MIYVLDVIIYDKNGYLTYGYVNEYSTLKKALQSGKDFFKTAIQKIYYGDDYDYNFEEQYWYTETKELKKMIKDLKLSYCFSIEESIFKFPNTYLLLNIKNAYCIRKINYFNISGKLLEREFKNEKIKNE